MVGAPGGDLVTAASSAGSRRPITNKTVSDGGLCTRVQQAYWLRTQHGQPLASRKALPAYGQTMLPIEREFGWPVAEQVGAVAEGRYALEINERVFQTEEGAA
jgi:hypothetical protein